MRKNVILLSGFCLALIFYSCNSTNSANRLATDGSKVSASKEVKESQKSNEMDFGTSYLALAVQDIAASLAFYQKLGFEPLPGAGGVEQKWMVLKNGDHKLGLFQGMFPKNTMTYNPVDARAIYKKAVEEGLETAFSSGMDKDEGPCNFSLVDPDGNPIARSGGTDNPWVYGALGCRCLLPTFRPSGGFKSLCDRR